MTDTNNDTNNNTNPPKLKLLNYANVLAYVANIVFTYGIGVMGWFGFQTNGDLSRKYQTLVTPTGSTFSIWGIIFISQFIFVVAQMLPRFRNHPLVIDGVRYTYVLGVCLFQIAWTFAFTNEVIWLAFLLMVGIQITLLKIMYDQSKLERGLKEFWLWKFPFAIHAAWITAATFVNLSAILVSQSVGPTVQYGVALASLVLVMIVGFFSLIYPTKPNYVHPLVLAWALFGIYSELKKPLELITSTFSKDQINAIQNGSLICFPILLVAVFVTAVMEIIHRRRQPNNGRNVNSDTTDREERGHALTTDDKCDNATLMEEAVSKASDGSDKGDTSNANGNITDSV